MSDWQATIWPCGFAIAWLPLAASASSTLIWPASASRCFSRLSSEALTDWYSASPGVLDSTAFVEACRVL